MLNTKQEREIRLRLIRAAKQDNEHFLVVTQESAKNKPFWIALGFVFQNIFYRFLDVFSKNSAFHYMSFRTKLYI